MDYKLYYKNVFICTIAQTDTDFPNLFGKYTINKNLIPKRINEYIEFSLKYSTLLENENLLDNFLSENDNFDDLVDSEDWYLIDENKSKENILVPNFFEDYIVWRWNF